MNPENLKWHKHENLVFYAKEAYDIEYRFPFGFKELEGIHARGDYDLTQHAKFSNKDLSYLDPYKQVRYVPHIIESSVGVGRMTLAFLTEAFQEEALADGETRMVLKFNPRIAPVKAAILPLQKKDGLADLAKEVAQTLRKATGLLIEYDESGSIGKRYRRQDEIGTPWCFTIDYQTKEDQTVTVRDRDTMSQERIALTDLPSWLTQKLARA
jgi:glycyl-tRNA synthetase